MMQKYLHIISISDDYVMADCFDIDHFDSAFILFIPEKLFNLHKNHNYLIDCDLLISYKMVENDLLIQDFAFKIIEDQISLYHIKNLYEVKTIDNQVNHYLNYPLKFNQHLDISNILKDVSKFILYSSGQGLFSALCNTQKQAVICYDMGCSAYHLKYNNKLFNLNLQKLKVIIISHRHLDHFNYFLRYHHQLLHCHLIINHNFLKANSLTIISILKKFKYNITFIEDELSFKVNDLKLTLFTTKTTNFKAHQDNLCLRIDALKNNLLLTADNYLDEIKDSYFKDLNYLLASHHGGLYYHQNKDCIIQNQNAILLVNSDKSYHKQYLKNYQAKNWHTILYSYNGDIILDLK